jgi:polyisoprenoid-binding protein YceI
MSLSKLVGGTLVAFIVTLLLGCSAATPAAGVPATAPAAVVPNAVAPAPTVVPVASPTTAALAVQSAQSTSTSPAPATTAPTGSNNSTIRITIDPTKSEARYRVREQLANVSLPTDAIGRTNAITGTIVGKPDGTIVSSESKFVVNLSTLKSDRTQRDGFIKGNVLQTNQYPDAVFVPTQQTGATYPPSASGPVTFKLTGDMTIRNVTKPVTWDVNCQPQGTEGMCHATTSFTFEYFDMTPPRVPIVLSVVDNINLEVDAALHLVSAGQ